MGQEIILNLLIFIPGFLLGIVVHEAAHAWMANRLGDPTARMLGRMTLNPLRHIDPWGTVVLPVFLLIMTRGSMVFGYARPTPVTISNFKNPRAGSFWVSLAGPLTNILAAIGIVLLAWGLRYLGLFNNPGTVAVLNAALLLNLIMAVFNLLPLPPLDGSEILLALLPGRWAYQYSRIAPYSFMIFMVLFLTGLLDRAS